MFESEPKARTPTSCPFLTSSRSATQLAAAAVYGLALAGRELRRRSVEVVFDGRPGMGISAPLVKTVARGREEEWKSEAE